MITRVRTDSLSSGLDGDIKSGSWWSRIVNIIPIIIQQHVEEAALLWLRRDLAVGAQHYSLDDLAKLDDRLEAHLDGLRVAGQPAWEKLVEELRWEEPGEIFPAAVMAFESDDPRRIQPVLEAASASYELSRPLVSALGWLEFGRASKHIGQLLDARDPTLRRMGLAALVEHRQDPGPALVAALADGDPLLQACALRAVGQLGRVDLAADVQARIVSESEPINFWAAWSSVLLTGNRQAVDVLKAVVQSGGGRCEAALQLVLRRQSLQDAARWMNEMATDLQLARLAVIGAGVIGTATAIPWLIDQMRIPHVARVAGEAFSTITRLDIAERPFEGEWPEGYEAGPTEDPSDDNVEMDPDEDLPWPNAESISRWWQDNGSQFRDDLRYLLGQPHDPDWLRHVLSAGHQRHRAAAALELAIRAPGSALFEVRAPGFRQQRLLDD